MPERRDFLALSLLSMAVDAEETLYIPERHRETDRAFIQSFLDEYSFAMVVTARNGIQLTNVPTLFTPGADEGWGTIWFHLAKNNRQNEALDGAAEALVVFHGPHGYISPNWYSASAASAHSVPTWNFAVAHATGRVKRLDDDRQFAANLGKLVEKNETRYGGGGGGRAWQFSNMPDSYLKGMRQGIVQYELTVDRVEAKFKLSQERSTPDQEGILKGLAAGRKERSLLELTRAYFLRAKARAKG